MNSEYVCYCGLYCENCAVKAAIDPAAQTLYGEMKAADFEHVMPYMPDGEAFWLFLRGMAERGTCTSCKAGSGNPACAVRVCAKEKGVEACALCKSYPCGHFDAFFAGYPMLKDDNALLKEKGWGAWAKLQDERRANGYTYANAKKKGG